MVVPNVGHEGLETALEEFEGELDDQGWIMITVKHNLPGSQKSADCPYQA